jgi:hypothetical protein
MFLYEPITLAQGAMWLLVLLALIGANEVSRYNKWTGIAFFIALPVVLAIFVWPKTSTVAGSSVNDWFHYAKVYSSLAGCVGFMAIRFIPRLQHNKIALAFPPLILSINILEAVIRDFQVFTFGANGDIIDGMAMVSGPWNIMNGIAGILNILTITGWFAIKASQTGKSKDMLWIDQIWPWIIAYDLWNYAYTYNCIGDHSFYAGLALLLSCTLCFFIFKKGAWLQHRAHTLAVWCMFAQTMPAFIDEGSFAVKASLNPTALFTVSFIALAANVAVAVYEIYVVRKTGAKPWKGEPVFNNTRAYREVSILEEAKHEQSKPQRKAA